MKKEEMLKFFQDYINIMDELGLENLYFGGIHSEKLNAGLQAAKLVQEYVKLSEEIEKLQSKANEMVQKIKEAVKVQIKFRDEALKEIIDVNKRHHELIEYIAEIYDNVEEINKYFIKPNPENEIGLFVNVIFDIGEIMYVENNQLVSFKSLNELADLPKEHIFVRKMNSHPNENSYKIYLSLKNEINKDGTVQVVILDDTGKKIF